MRILRTTICAFVAITTLACCYLGSPAGDRLRTPLGARLHQMASQAPIVVAHRGDSGHYPENTLPAFAAAITEHAQMVELDFRQTADGELVCMHDATLDRTTDAQQKLGKKKVSLARHTSAQIAPLDAGRWKHIDFTGTKIPTLRAALSRIQRGAITMIERKAGTPEALAELLRDLELEDDVLVQSFDWGFLERFHALSPRVTLAALGSKNRHPEFDAATLARLDRMQCSMVHWSFKDLDRATVDRLQALGYLVCVFTIDRPEEFSRALELGVDAITTNFPGRLRKFLATQPPRRM